MYPPRMCDVVCLCVVLCVSCRIMCTKSKRNQFCKRGRGRETVTESEPETRAQPHVRAVRPAQATNHNAQAPGPPPPSCGASPRSGHLPDRYHRVSCPVKSVITHDRPTALAILGTLSFRSTRGS